MGAPCSFVALGLVPCLLALLGRASAQQCEPTDVIILLDGSTSMGNLNFQKELNFAKYLMMSLNLSPGGTEAMLLQYSDSSNPETPFVTSASDAITEAHDVAWMMGGSFLTEAMIKSGNILEERVKQGRVGAKAVVVITDGKSQSTVPPAMITSVMMSRGIQIYAVAITELLDLAAVRDLKEELLDVTEDESNVLMANTFDELSMPLAQAVAARLHAVICPQPEPENGAPGQDEDAEAGTGLGHGGDTDLPGPVGDLEIEGLDPGILSILGDDTQSGAEGIANGPLVGVEDPITAADDLRVPESKIGQSNLTSELSQRNTNDRRKGAGEDPESNTAEENTEPEQTDRSGLPVAERPGDFQSQSPDEPTNQGIHTAGGAGEESGPAVHGGSDSVIVDQDKTNDHEGIESVGVPGQKLLPIAPAANPEGERDTILEQAEEFERRPRPDYEEIEQDPLPVNVVIVPITGIEERIVMNPTPQPAEVIPGSPAVQVPPVQSNGNTENIPVPPSARSGFDGSTNDEQSQGHATDEVTEQDRGVSEGFDNAMGPASPAGFDERGSAPGASVPALADGFGNQPAAPGFDGPPDGGDLTGRRGNPAQDPVANVPGDIQNSDGASDLQKTSDVGNPALEPVDCLYTYETLVPCSLTCGTGGFSINRLMVHHPAANGGRPCPPDLMQDACKVPLPACQLSPLSPATPDQDGGVFIEDETAPAQSGLKKPPSPGSTTAATPLTLPPGPALPALPSGPAAPVDCEYELGDWSHCSKSCGDSFHVRLVIVTQQPANGGKPCPADKLVKEKCDVPECPEEILFDCMAREDGNYQYGEECQQRFITCSGGTPYLFPCPGGLYFNKAKGYCDTWFYACGGNKRTDPVTQEPKVVEDLTSEFDCRRKDEGDYANPGNQCSEFFYKCSQGVTHRIDCPQGLFYSPSSNACNQWTYVFECSGKQPPTTTTVDPSELLLQDQVVYPVDCTRKENGNYKHPEHSCNSVYYSCSHGRTVEQRCPTATFYDEQRDHCDSRQFVPACGGSHRTTTPKPEVEDEPVAKTDFGFDCSKRDNKNFGAGDCVDHYFTCAFGVTHKRACPRHLRYDIEFDRCEKQKFVPLCGGTRPPTTTTPKPHPTEELAIDCKRKADRGYQDPSLQGGCAQKYIVCANHNAFRFTCTGDLYFHEKKQQCLLKAKVPECHHRG